jgi:hypothetical protein
MPIHLKDFVSKIILLKIFSQMFMDILVECKVYFTHEAVSVDCEIILQVALKYGEL